MNRKSLVIGLALRWSDHAGEQGKDGVGAAGATRGEQNSGGP